MEEYLRKECRLLKALQNVSYKEIAKRLGIKTDSMYSWLNGNYSLSNDRQQDLMKIIKELRV